MELQPAELIKRKRDNYHLTPEEIEFFINGYTSGKIPDYQMSAFMMATYFRGMNHKETLALTKCMLKSGASADFSNEEAFIVDKHSTGGVGDKTTLILGPIVAACGLKMPSIAGRGLGHTGGTLDKLESIPGFQIRRSLEQFVTQTRALGVCFIGQSEQICPADRLIYSLRDVTATVESLPLICASILSKKLAEGIGGLVLDVKYGNGAFMKTMAQAEELAQLLMDVTKMYGKKVSALLTDMNQPLGRYAGNSLEITECVEIMSGVRHPMTEDTRELSLRLAAQMLVLSGRSAKDAYRLAEEALTNGRALEKFRELCVHQCGRLDELPSAKGRLEVKAETEGFLYSYDTEGIGYAGISLRAGRLKTDDVIDPTSGIEFHKKLGDQVHKGDVIFTIHGDDATAARTASQRLSSCFTSSLQKPARLDLVGKILI